MHKLFYSAKLKKKADPDVFIMNLKDIRAWMEMIQATMSSDDQFMMHILNNLTSDYSMDISKFEDRIGAKNEPLDIKDMCDTLSLMYERISEGFYSNERDEEETTLAAGQFKSRCNKCGKYGHKSADCRLPKQRPRTRKFRWQVQRGLLLLQEARSP
jgi:hypothetical protein